VRKIALIAVAGKVPITPFLALHLDEPLLLAAG